MIATVERMAGADGRAAGESLEWLLDLFSRCLGDASAAGVKPQMLVEINGGVRLFERVRELEAEYPIELEAPFEGVESIAGGVWNGAELVGTNRTDAVAKLRFEAGTDTLPFHVHECSDRVIVALSGRGTFHFSSTPLADFTGDGLRSLSVEPGDVLLFTRGLMHTFSAADSDLVLLSYHSPAIDFDDPRQYTLPDITLRPCDLRAEVRYH